MTVEAWRAVSVMNKATNAGLANTEMAVEGRVSNSAERGTTMPMSDHR